jgi:predicted metal-dependent phosphoesterase TrpH
MVSLSGVACTPMAVWGRADLHTHTNLSDGWPTPLQLVEHAARRARLDLIAVTDHDTIEGALRAAECATRFSKLQVVVGEEVSSSDGHIIGLFLEKRVKPGLSAAATVHAIHEQGGIAIAAHPFWRTQRLVRNGNPVHGVGWLAAELPFDAVEVENATPGFYVFNQLARRLNMGLGAAELGGSDAHIVDAVGRAFTQFPGKSPDALRKAIELGQTRAARRRYRPVGLVRYAAWGLNHQRYVVAV